MTAEVWQRFTPVMKLPVFLTLVVLSILLSGCVVGPHELVLDTVGPSSMSPQASSPSGSLTVYSAYDFQAHFNSRHDYGREYSDYEIFTVEGQFLERVHNDSGTILDEPAHVSLPPGEYCVVARANGYGRVRVPVVVAPHQATVVHLDEDAGWRHGTRLNATNAVRLPGGSVVGIKTAEP